ncbi:uncharacterized, partial [Tachysurus ichikawai]
HLLGLGNKSNSLGAASDRVTMSNGARAPAWSHHWPPPANMWPH